MNNNFLIDSLNSLSVDFGLTLFQILCGVMSKNIDRRISDRFIEYTVEELPVSKPQKHRLFSSNRCLELVEVIVEMC